jgi:pyruvate dehydrogenase E1 component beta subunit
MVHRALEAAADMEKDGISAEVVDPRTLQPLDNETIVNSIKKTHRAVIVHEAVKFAGPGAEIAAMIAEEAFDYLDAPIKRVTAPFTPVPFSPPLEKEFIPSKEKIASAVKALLQE